MENVMQFCQGQRVLTQCLAKDHKTLRPEAVDASARSFLTITQQERWDDCVLLNKHGVVLESMSKSVMELALGRKS